MDVPQEQLRSIILPADPVPIQNARQDPNMFMGQSSAISAINNSTELVVPTPYWINAGYSGYTPTTQLTFDSASALNVTLRDNNATVVNTSTASGGAKVIDAKSSGQWYFEVELSALSSLGGGSGLQAGIDIDADSFTTAISTGSNGTMVDLNGVIWSLGTNTGNNIGTLQEGDVIAVCYSASNNLAWFRKTPGGYWNGTVGADPYTLTGGVSVTSATSVEPFVCFDGTNGTINNAWSVNTNAALFAGHMPLGYVAWGVTLTTNYMALESGLSNQITLESGSGSILLENSA